MKKIWKSIMAVVCFTLIISNLTACALFNQKEIISAYDIAVKNGFVGTEEEWLASLKGSNGLNGDALDIQDIYEEAQKNGYSGSFLEFLKEYLDADITEDNNTTTIAENMLSVVSIYSGFSKKPTSLYGKIDPSENYASAGSGVIIDLNKEAGNALIVTNYHVIYDENSSTSNHISDAIYLYPYGAFNQFSKETLSDEKGDGIKARYVGGAMDYDIALLRIEGSEFIRNNPVSVAEIGDSESMQAGEKVFAVGNPDGAGISVVGGIISVESEYIEMAATDGTNRTVSYRVMRTDAAINSGNSGGALFNAQGKLIGITNAKNVGSDVDNMCYALPINPVINLCNNILDNNGTLQRAMLGIMAEKSSSKAVYENGRLYTVEEIIVSSKEGEIATTAAAYGKLKTGDKLISLTVGEKTYPITKLHHTNDALLTVRKGDTVTLKVIRNGEEIDVIITYDKDSYFTEYN